MNSLLYGANGYTGRLILAECLARGMRPVLGGRSPELRELAGAHGLEARVVGLDDPVALRAALDGIGVVLHAAGPFAHTFRPMAEACLATGAHYLDITGEISVFESLAARSDAGKRAGVMLLPGIGFDVVPSDCLAAHLKRRLPGASSLILAFQSSAGLSRGTATTMIENIGLGGAVRRGGKIVRVPPAWRTRLMDFGRGPVTVTTIPWGDVATAWHSTGIPDIEVYTRTNRVMRTGLRLSRWLGPVLRTGPAQRMLKRRIRARITGPDQGARERGWSVVIGEVRDGEGNIARARLNGPEGYTLTARSAVEGLQRVLAGEATPGFRTPSLAFGADFVLRIEGVTREDL